MASGSNPGWFPGYIPSAAEWNSVFSGKLDLTDPIVTGGVYMPMSGGTFTGPISYTATGGTASRSAQDRASDRLNALDLGFVGDGVTDNNAAMISMFALPGNPTVYFPPGVFYLGTGAVGGRDATSNLSIVGAGMDRTILRLAPGIALAANFWRWYLKTDPVVLRDFTLDLNGATSSAHMNVVFFRNCSKMIVDRIGVINAGDNMQLISVSTEATFTTSDYWITNTRTTLTNPGTLWGAGICINANAPSGTTVGIITRGHIQNNVCVNTGIRIDGSYNIVTGNEMSGSIYPAFWSYPSYYNPNSGWNIIANNHMHDTGTVLDGDGVPADGMEFDSDFSILANNLAERCGGPGFVVFARNSYVTGNVAIGCGRVATPRAPYDQCGFRVPGTYGTGTKFIGNIAKDDGGGTQLYGYYEEAAAGANIELRSNSFTGVTAGMVVTSATTTIDVHDKTTIGRAPQNSLTITPGAASTNAVALTQSGTGGVSLPAISGTLTVGISGTNNALTFTPGLAPTNAITLGMSGTGGLIVTPAMTLSAALTMNAGITMTGATNWLQVGQTGSTNTVSVRSAAAGARPALIGGGVDTDVDLTLSTKGAGQIVVLNPLAIGATNGPTITQGSAAPAATTPVGSLYLRTGGAAGSRLYVSAGAGTWTAVAGV